MIGPYRRIQSQHPALATRQVGSRVGGLREIHGAPGSGVGQASGACSSGANAATPTTGAQRFRVGGASKRPQAYRFPKVQSAPRVIGNEAFHRRRPPQRFAARPYVGHARYGPPTAPGAMTATTGAAAATAGVDRQRNKPATSPTAPRQPPPAPALTLAGTLPLPLLRRGCMITGVSV